MHQTEPLPCFTARVGFILESSVTKEQMCLTKTLPEALRLVSLHFRNLLSDLKMFKKSESGHFHSGSSMCFNKPLQDDDIGA